MPTAQLRRQIAFLALLSVVFFPMGCSRLPSNPPAISEASSTPLVPTDSTLAAAAPSPTRQAQARGKDGPPFSEVTGKPDKDAYPRRLTDFESVLNPDGFARPYETANMALQKKFGKGYFAFRPGLNYSSARPIPSLPFENLIIPVPGAGLDISNVIHRVPPKLAALLTEQRVYLLGPSDLNDFLSLYGNPIEIPGNRIPGELSLFFALYGNEDERIIEHYSDILPYTIGQLGSDFDATKLSPTELVKKGDPRYQITSPVDQPHLLAMFNTCSIDYPIQNILPPFKANLIITRYLAIVQEKGEITLTILERNKYILYDLTKQK